MTDRYTTPCRESFYAIVFGGGLAGCVLADHLRRSGQPVLLVDDPQLSRCSRVAAGLINPISGKRLKLAWRAEETLPYSYQHYEQLERAYQAPFLHRRRILRLFSQPEEARLWQSRQQEPGYARWSRPMTPDIAPPAFAGAEGFLVPDAAYLDIGRLLDAIKSAAEAEGWLLRDRFRYDEVEEFPAGVAFRGLAARYAIFAEGHLASRNPWFRFVPYRPAKGVIGLARIDAPLPSDLAVHQNKFLLPRQDGLFSVGATFRWDENDETPSSSEVQELESFLDERLRGLWRWEEVAAGVRPAVAGAFPVVGPHPDHPGIVAFNGFGSKGSLLIPFFAKQLLESLRGEHALPPETHPKRFLKKEHASPLRWRATAVARDRVLSVLRSGDLAIDATMGNGHDTAWLCQAVGESGHVFAFDVQRRALETTRNRLQSLSLAGRASLLLCGHEVMLDALPATSRGRIAAIVFNLGYLPHGDGHILTRAETTLTALDAALRFLKPGGLLAATLYPAHPGGDIESRETLEWLSGLPRQEFATEIVEHPARNANSPFPVFVTKLQTSGLR